MGRLPAGTKVSKVERLEKAHEKAARALNAEVRRMFPKGTRVRVRWGNGWMLATVSVPNTCWWSRPADVIVLSDKGRVHHKHFKDLEKI